MNKEKFFKDLENWEQEYSAMDVPRTEREQELLDGGDIKSHEGMVYGRMYSDWKTIKGYSND
tara:strand:+ start:280 stop:465 length:186 start_codon:yes stop_codon:yes gene_type:complete